MDVVLWMCSKHLQLDAVIGNRLDVVPIKPEGKTSCTFQELCRELKDIILFVDEALPKVADEHPSSAINRLRFVRNLGRALTMKVVLAGTAATAANMIAEPETTKTESRSADEDEEYGEMAWIECQFLWKPMVEEEVKKVVLSELKQPNVLANVLGEAVISALVKGRPHLVHLFVRFMKGRMIDKQSINTADLREVLEKVGKVLAKVKDLSDKTKVIHLTGAWLHQMYTSPCAYYVQPAELVRGSYFEPCGVLDDKNPACGLRMGKRSLAPGPLRVKIYREHDNNDIMWCASVKDEKSEEQREGYCSDFSGIEYSLSACVQQCLAREPLLAVALSTQCRMNKATFRKALSTLSKETVLQRAAHKADGELNEQVMFAVLQLASNSTRSRDTEQTLFGDKVNLGTFLREIAHFLRNESFAERVEAFRDKLDKYQESGPSQVRQKRIPGTRNTKFEIDKMANEYTMPWLVPACSLKDLEKTSRSAPRLFDLMNIAGLVPAIDHNAAFDAEAYPWENLPCNFESKHVSQPEWVFEFKIR